MSLLRGWTHERARRAVQDDVRDGKLALQRLSMVATSTKRPWIPGVSVVVRLGNNQLPDSSGCEAETEGVARRQHDPSSGRGREQTVGGDNRWE